MAAYGCPPTRATSARPPQIPEAERDYFLERKYPSFGNLVPRDVASRNAKQVCDEGRGVGESGLAVYLDFRDAIERLGKHVIKRALRQPLRHVRAHHRRRSLPGAHAHLPRHALHHGRPVGGLQPDVHHPRPVRDRRGQFLRPRRQPPGRQRADAGPGGRLFRPAQHHRRLPGFRPSSRRWMPPTPPCAKPKRRWLLHDQAAARDQGHALGGFLPSRAGQADVGVLRHGAHRRRA